MLRFSNKLPLLLVSLCLVACSEPPPARPPALGPCVATAPTGGVTSKVRHVPNEDDPCADSRGVAPRAQP